MGFAYTNGKTQKLSTAIVFVCFSRLFVRFLYEETNIVVYSDGDINQYIAIDYFMYCI